MSVLDTKKPQAKMLRVIFIVMAERTGLEPVTSCVTGRHSNQAELPLRMYRVPGSDLLSHKRTLHYHRRGCISLLCSEWEQVVLQRYGRQAYSFNLRNFFLYQLLESVLTLLQTLRCLPGLYGQDSRTISTGKLHSSRSFHIQPINVVVFNSPYVLMHGMTHLKACFPLRCFQRLSVPGLAAGPCHWHDNP